jgi:hypothetical protein
LDAAFEPSGGGDHFELAGTPKDRNRIHGSIAFWEAQDVQDKSVKK